MGVFVYGLETMKGIKKKEKKKKEKKRVELLRAFTQVEPSF